MSRRAKNPEAAKAQKPGLTPGRGQLHRLVRWTTWSRELAKAESRRRFAREVRLLCSSRRERAPQGCHPSCCLNRSDLTQESLDRYSRLGESRRSSWTAQRSVGDVPSESETAERLRRYEEIWDNSQRARSAALQNEMRSRSRLSRALWKCEYLGTAAADRVCAIASLLRSFVLDSLWNARMGLLHLTRMS